MRHDEEREFLSDDEKKSLLRAVEPDRDLWPGIASRIGAARSGTEDEPAPFPTGVRRRRWAVPSRRGRRVIVAAAVVLVAFLAVVARRGPGPDRPGPAGQAMEQAMESERAAGVERLFDGPERIYREGDRDLLRAASSGDDPERSIILRQFAPSLERVDFAIDEIRAAWLADPEDPFLTKRLAKIYLTKSELQGKAIRLLVKV